MPIIPVTKIQTVTGFLTEAPIPSFNARTIVYDGAIPANAPSAFPIMSNRNNLSIAILTADALNQNIIAPSNGRISNVKFGVETNDIPSGAGVGVNFNLIINATTNILVNFPKGATGLGTFSSTVGFTFAKDDTLRWSIDIPATIIPSGDTIHFTYLEFLYTALP